tara:strand:+ start:1642 stop:2319 length:678 start_codon:yes stop_codon:yes gene_type:complete
MPNARVRAVSHLLSKRVTAPRPANLGSSGISVKKDQAWKYPGGNVVRAPSKRLGASVYSDPKDPAYPRREQESNFFITINTNKSPDDDELQLATRKMEQLLDQLRDPSVLAKYVKFGPKDAAYSNDNYSDVIKSVTWNGAAETGDIFKRVHAHVWLSITHYSQIQIDVVKLMAETTKRFNSGLPLGSPLRVDKPYIHVKLLPQSTWASVIQGYVQKGMLKNGPGA